MRGLLYENSIKLCCADKLRAFRDKAICKPQHNSEFIIQHTTNVQHDPFRCMVDTISAFPVS